MAGYPDGDASPSTLFAYADAQDDAAPAPGIADDAAQAGYDPFPDAGELIHSPPTPPWLDDAVIRYGQTGQPPLHVGDEEALRNWLQPNAARQPSDSTAPAQPGPPVPGPGDYDSHLDPKPVESIDPEVQRKAEAIRDQIRRQPDYDQFEYSGTIYRDRTGKIVSTPLLRGSEGQVGLQGVPSGATILGFVHNHPIKTERDSAAGTGRSEDDIVDFLGHAATEPSAQDMGATKAAFGNRADQSALVYLYGPDGILRAFDPNFIGHPTTKGAQANIDLAKPSWF